MSEAEGGGKMIARVRLGMFAEPLARQLGTRVMLEIPLQSQSDLGLPSMEEQNLLDEIERGVVAVASASGEAELVLLVSSNNTRTLILQASDGAWAERHKDALGEALGAYSAEILVEDDPGWDVYRSFEAKAD